MSAALRFISVILIAFGLMLLGADLITSLEKGGVLQARTIEQIWALFSKGSEMAFNAWVQRALPVPLARLIGSILSLWAWSIPGVLGVVLAILFGRKAVEE
jgi:hypothetical protein